LDESTIFAGLYGAFRPHAGSRSGAEIPDVFSAFVASSFAAAHGFPELLPDEALTPDPLWHMNDGGGADLASDSGRAAWVQVALPASRLGRPLPVQPLLADLAQATDRLGNLDLAGVQLLLPLGYGSPSTTFLAQTLPLFWAARDHGTRSAVAAVTVRGRGALDDVGYDIVGRLAERNTGSFRIESYESTAGPEHDLRPFVVDDWWWDAESRQDSGFFRMVLPEWSVPAIGWIVALLAGELAGRGLGTARLSVR
jgi:hypothetical protein